MIKRTTILLVLLLLTAHTCWGARAKIDTVSRDPYVSALVLDADTGKVLVEENSDAVIYPASVLKLMVFYVILDRIEQGALRLDDMVQVTREAAQMGGSQVYLDPKEQFSVEDLLYALIIQSANDAAVALAMHVAGTKAGFVEIMNQKAAELGMTSTSFHSVHGLPPSEGQGVDTTTARDLGILARELAKNPDVFTYTGTRERDFRNGEFIMRTHNKLLVSVDGCDGFKTGYFKAAGFSIVVTAKRRGVRIIAIVLGSVDRRVRDAKASEMLAIGFAKVPPRTEPVVSLSKPAAPRATPAQTTTETAAQINSQTVAGKAKDTDTLESASPEAAAAESKRGDRSWGRDLLLMGVGFVAGIAFCLAFALLKPGGRSTRRRRLV